MPSYLSINEFPGDGSTTQHNFSFAGGYIDKAHVKAVVYDAAGGATPITITSPMWVGANTLNLGVSAPVGGYTKIYRETPRDLPLVDFADRARLREANLDLLARQVIFVAAEAFDAGSYASVNDLLSAAAVSASAASAAAAASATSANTSTTQAAAAIAAAAQAAATLSSAVLNTGDQTIAGIKTFTASPVVPAGASGARVPQAQEIGALTVAQRADLFRRANILATVTQSGGVPTGGLIETGSNTNGRYVRFADGTQVCWKTPFACGASGGTTWVFPAAFGGAEVSQGLAIGYGAYVTPLVYTGSNNVQMAFAAYDHANNQVAANLTVFAFGRWF